VRLYLFINVSDEIRKLISLLFETAVCSEADGYRAFVLFLLSYDKNIRSLVIGGDCLDA
jgi:hypothetical protein